MMNAETEGMIENCEMHLGIGRDHVEPIQWHSMPFNGVS